jgi:hypothetical protein
MMREDEDEALVSAKGSAYKLDWVERTVQLAQTCNQILSANACRLCYVYVDKQVEYETRQQQPYEGNGRAANSNRSPHPLPGALERVWTQTATSPHFSMEVDFYRQLLFDEDSVVDAVSERDPDSKDEEDDETEEIDETLRAIATQRSR